MRSTLTRVSKLSFSLMGKPHIGEDARVRKGDLKQSLINFLSTPETIKPKNNVPETRNATAVSQNLDLIWKLSYHSKLSTVSKQCFYHHNDLHIHFEMKSTLLLEIHKCHYIQKRWSYLVEARFPGKLFHCNLFCFASFYKVWTRDQIEP